MSHMSSKIDPRPRSNLRLEPELWDAIDAARKARPGNVSRNTWIAEAVLEKVARDVAIDQKEVRNA